MSRIFSTLLFVAVLSFPIITFARIGVGIGTGKIEIDRPLKPGEEVVVPSITILNTGDEPGEYAVFVEYFETQEELKPPREWFSFSPEEFKLEPGGGRGINIKLRLPVDADPGDYFAFIEGRPTKRIGSPGGASIGIAAATKLRFTIEPATQFQAYMYVLRNYYRKYAYYIRIFLYLVGAAIAISIFRRFFKLNIGLKKK